jgi:aspartate-semialdehyde dehydrogenase
VHRIAIVEPTTLLGREVKETLEGRPGLAADLRLLTTREEEYGTLTEIAGAAALVAHATPETVADLDLLLVCGELSAIRPLLDALPAGATVVLLSPDATLADGVPVVAGVNPGELERGTVLLSPHPAAVLLAHLLHPLAGLGLEQAVATVIQPTSMYGDPGIDELLEQTRRILAMAGPPSGGPFGGQLAFNVLPGATAGESVAGQAAATLDFRGPLAVEVLQGAVFHGMAASLWVEVEGATEPEALEDALLSSAWIERSDTPESLGPVAAAAEAHILLGSVRADAARPGGFWIRAVMDNLTRGGALNAVEIATAVLS